MECIANEFSLLAEWMVKWTLAIKYDDAFSNIKIDVHRAKWRDIKYRAVSEENVF